MSYARPLIVCLLLGAPWCGLAAQLSAPDQSLASNQSSIVSFSLDSAGQAIAAVQFDLEWDTSLALNVVPGDQLRAAGKVLYSAPLSPQSVRCLVSGINQTVLGDGELLRFFVSVVPSSPPGSAAITITNLAATDADGNAASLQANPVNVQIAAGVAVTPLLPNAVLNAATLQPGPISPGEIITVLGFDAVPGVSLRIGGVPCPVLYQGANQMNAIVPFGIDLTTSATLAISGPSQTTQMLLPVAPAAPGVFTVNGAGLGPGAILNEDYSLNSYANAASPGSVVMVYGTGFGALSSPLPDGQTATATDQTAATVSATVAGLPAEVLYAGEAPGLVAGVIQLNVRLPAAVAHNLSAPLVFTLPGPITAGGATVAIQ